MGAGSCPCLAEWPKSCTTYRGRISFTLDESKNFSSHLEHIPPRKPQPNAPFAQRVALRSPAVALQYYRATRGMSREQALREVARLRVESAVSEARGTHAWPQVIKEGAITVPDFNGLTLDGFMGSLGTPIPTSKIYLYRGMGLQEAGLRNILKHGHRPEDSGSMSNEVNVQTHLCSSGPCQPLPMCWKKLTPAKPS